MVLQERSAEADPGFNRNIVECKSSPNGSGFSSSPVLIETLWNVNSFSLFQLNNTGSVLIETLWNVN